MRGAQNVLLKLRWREVTGKARRPYTQVPGRLQVPVQAILDAERSLLSCVLLGFTRDGDHLISYTTTPVPAADNQEGYHLQVWKFSLTSRVERLCNIPLFSTSDEPDEAEELWGDSAMGVAKMVTVCETVDSRFLIVHGRSATDRGQELVNHLTVIPFPPAGCACMEVAHAEYVTIAPHPQFHPFFCLLPSNTLMLATSSGVQTVQLHFQQQPAGGRPCDAVPPAGREERDGHAATASAQLPRLEDGGPGRADAAAPHQLMGAGPPAEHGDSLLQATSADAAQQGFSAVATNAAEVCDRHAGHAVLDEPPVGPTLRASLPWCEQQGQQLQPKQRGTGAGCALPGAACPPQEWDSASAHACTCGPGCSRGSPSAKRLRNPAALAEVCIEASDCKRMRSSPVRPSQPLDSIGNMFDQPALHLQASGASLERNRSAAEDFGMQTACPSAVAVPHPSARQSQPGSASCAHPATPSLAQTQPVATPGSGQSLVHLASRPLSPRPSRQQQTTVHTSSAAPASGFASSQEQTEGPPASRSPFSPPPATPAGDTGVTASGVQTTHFAKGTGPSVAAHISFDAAFLYEPFIIDALKGDPRTESSHVLDYEAQTVCLYPGSTDYASTPAAMRDRLRPQPRRCACPSNSFDSSGRDTGGLGCRHACQLGGAVVAIVARIAVRAQQGHRHLGASNLDVLLTVDVPAAGPATLAYLTLEAASTPLPVRVSLLASQLRRLGNMQCSAAMTPITLSNASVLNTGLSVPALCHPFLPVCILGYQAHHAECDYQSD